MRQSAQLRRGQATGAGVTIYGGTDARTRRRGLSLSRGALGSANAETTEVRSIRVRTQSVFLYCFVRPRRRGSPRRTQPHHYHHHHHRLPPPSPPPTPAAATTTTTARRHRHRTPRKQNRLKNQGHSAPDHRGHKAAPPCRSLAFFSPVSSPFNGCTHHLLLVFVFGLLLPSSSSSRKSCAFL